MLGLFSSERIITYSGGLMRIGRTSHSFAHKTENDWYDSAIQMWRIAMFWEATTGYGDGQLAREAIESGVMFLLEEWSIAVKDDRQFGTTSYSTAISLS